MTTPSTVKPSLDDSPGNADWLRASWDVRGVDGEPVTSLKGLADVMGVDERQAAEQLLAQPFGKAAPAVLRSEAETLLAGGDALDATSWDDLLDPQAAPAGAPAEAAEEGSIFDGTDEAEGKGFVPFAKGSNKPKTGDDGKVKEAGDGQAKVKRGDYVRWSGGSGRVDLIVIGGVVPGMPKGDKPVFGSSTGPACRVVKYEKDGNGWKVTTTKVAVKASDLTKIDDLKPKTKAESKGMEALVAMIADRESPLGREAKIAYQRGESGWPGPERTTLSRDEWALGRAKALLDAADGYPLQGFADGDLLPE
jgi:hypothetical protein